jgi:hypothetical protein
LIADLRKVLAKEVKDRIQLEARLKAEKDGKKKALENSQVTIAELKNQAKLLRAIDEKNKIPSGTLVLNESELVDLTPLARQQANTRAHSSTKRPASVANHSLEQLEETDDFHW